MGVPVEVRLRLERLVAWMEGQDESVAAHGLRVSRLARELGLAAGLHGERLEVLTLGARLHDLGKAFFGADVLHKAERLSAEERNALQGHAQAGALVMESMDLPFPFQEIAACHHERFDGTGYPRGLKGAEIPFLARLTSVADAFDAMTVTRDYHRALPREAACQEILDHCGTQFCPEAVAAFIQVFQPEAALA